MKKYYKDYEMIQKTQANGKVKEEAKYIGDYYISQISKVALNRKKIYHSALSLCSVAIVIAVGILNTPGSRVIYVSLPYVCLYIPAIFSLIGTTQFLGVGERLEYMVYDKTRNRVRKSIGGIIVISLLTIIGDVFFILYRHPIERLQVELIFLTGITILLILNAFFLYKIQKEKIYKKEESVKQ